MASILSVEQLRGLSSGDNPNTITLPTGQTLDFSAGTLSMPAGHVIQIKHAYKTDTQSLSNGADAFVECTGLSVTLTPASASSTFLILFSVAHGNGGDLSHGHTRIHRNDSPIGNADAAGNREPSVGVVNTGAAGQINVVSNSILDEPNTTGNLTYKVMVARNAQAGQVSYINRSSRDINSRDYDGRTTSSLTVMEIAG